MAGTATGQPQEVHTAGDFQELAWAAAIRQRDGIVTDADCECFAYRLGDQYVDNNLADFAPVSWERFLERRRSIYEVFSMPSRRSASSSRRD
jgi:hypothetical protein